MVEAVVGVALSLIFILAFASLTIQAIKLNRYSDERLRANIHLQELVEIAKDLELSKSWSVITLVDCAGSPCYPYVDGANWKLASGEESLDSDFFKRSITVADVQRDPITHQIAEAGTLDNFTKKIIATIEWSDGSHPPMTLETYVYSYQP